MIRSVFRYFSILADNQNLVGKQNSMRLVGYHWKALSASAQLPLGDPKQLTQALVNVWLLWPLVCINEKYVYNS